MLRNAFENLATDSKLELARTLLESIDSKLHVNADDRLRVSTMPSRYDLLTGYITAVGQTVVINTDNISNLMLHCKANPTVVGHTCIFEGSLDSTDGTNGTWFIVQAVRSNANTVETGTGSTALAATPVYGWEMSVNAVKWIRVRATAHTSGNMQWMLQAGSYATEPIPANQVASVTASIRGMGGWFAETTTNLANGATFTGSNRAQGSSSISYYSKMRYRIFSSHSGTLTIENSRDTTAGNFRANPDCENIPIEAGVVKFITCDTIAYYTRCKFTNTGGATTTTLEILSQQII